MMMITNTFSMPPHISARDVPHYARFSRGVTDASDAIFKLRLQRRHFFLPIRFYFSRKHIEQALILTFLAA